MKAITRHIGRLTVVNRLTNSVNGNPRYLLQCDGYIFRTKVDSAHAYDVSTLENSTVVVTIGTHYGKPTLHTIEAA